MDPSKLDPRAIGTLKAIMEALRAPVTGCPWDIEQTFETIAPYTIEEAYEVADAIQRKNFADLCEELGDLLLQVIYHAQMAREAGKFEFEDVVEAINRKMIRRHPHVFGDARARTAKRAKGSWERMKAAELKDKQSQHNDTEHNGVLNGVPAALPALMRASKLQRKAARVGFDWPRPQPVLDKVKEEVGEIEAALPNANRAEITEEIGDVLFAVTNLARHLDIDAEHALRCANDKFVSRFESIEMALHRRGSSPEEASLDDMEELWQAAKKRTEDVPPDPT